MDIKKYYLVSLGCAKNTVDSKSIEALLQQAGYTRVEKPAWANLLIVNTCGFIQPAREESIQVLERLAAKKHSGQYLIAAGCLPERHRSLIAEQVRGVDGFLGTRRWTDILELIDELRNGRSSPEPVYHIPEDSTVQVDGPEGIARFAVQGASAYIKIADGCRRSCAFCSIPLIKGTAVSRPIDHIVAEAKMLEKRGVKEIILISQDTTDYGYDLGIKDGLSFLLERLVIETPAIPWIRVMYTYPGYVTDRLIHVMADHPQIVPYLDMPLQHAHPETLRRMRRPADMDWVENTLGKMRASLPGLALRTTMIVGYPGETEEEFETLLEFIRKTRFDHLGVFQFSFEPGTASELLGDPIPATVKQERVEQVMLLQQGISLSINQGLVGKTMKVLIEGHGKGLSIGRTYRDAPEIDGLAIIEGHAPIGHMVDMKITGAMAHDLVGRLVG